MTTLSCPRLPPGPLEFSGFSGVLDPLKLLAHALRYRIREAAGEARRHSMASAFESRFGVCAESAEDLFQSACRKSSGFGALMEVTREDLIHDVVPGRPRQPWPSGSRQLSRWIPLSLVTRGLGARRISLAQDPDVLAMRITPLSPSQSV